MKSLLDLADINICVRISSMEYQIYWFDDDELANFKEQEKDIVVPVCDRYFFYSSFSSCT